LPKESKLKTIWLGAATLNRVAYIATVWYITKMIKSFSHKGLEVFFTMGSTKGIQFEHKSRLELILQALHTATDIQDMDIPGWRLHELSGKRKGTWSVRVSGNWRVTFEIHDGHVYVTNYEDYH